MTQPATTGVKSALIYSPHAKCDICECPPGEAFLLVVDPHGNLPSTTEALPTSELELAMSATWITVCPHCIVAVMVAATTTMTMVHGSDNEITRLLQRSLPVHGNGGSQNWSA